MFYKSTGILHYSIEDSVGYKLVLLVDKDLVNYYKSLIPRYYDHIPQKFDPHISVVRKENPKLDNWGLREGQEIPFCYDNTIYMDERYYWIKVYSIEIEAIRTELGLSLEDRYNIPPEGFNKTFHITLCNKKYLVR